MFSILLQNNSQSLNTFEILVWDIFAFFASKFADLAAKRTLIEAISNENQITQTYCRSEIIQLYEQEQATLHFYHSFFFVFSAVFHL